jgi:hypothetical protein
MSSFRSLAYLLRTKCNFHGTLFSLELMNRPNKLEFLFLTSLSGVL